MNIIQRFNLTGSAERDGVRIIATVFGGKSTPDRNARMAELLDLGFRKAGKNVVEEPPTKVAPADDEALVADAGVAADEDEALPEVEGGAAKTLRVQLAVASSPRPLSRPEHEEAAGEAVAAMQGGIAGALAEATAPAEEGTLDGQAVAMAEPQELSITAAPAVSTQVALIAVAPRPPKRKAPIYDEPQLAKAEAAEVQEPELVTLSTSGGRHYGVMVGQFSSNGEADRFLTKTVLAEGPTLGNGLRKVVRGNRGYDATVLGLTQREAELACSRLQSKGIGCFTIGE